MRVGLCTLFVCELAGGWLGVLGETMSSRVQAVAVVVAAVVVAVVIGAWALVVEPAQQQSVAARAAATATPAAAPTPTRKPAPRIAVIGDSYSAGTDNELLWHHVVANRLPATVTDLSLGGAGYTVPSRDFAAQASKLPQDTDLVIVAGSRNDQYTPEAVGPAASKLFAGIKSKAPKARIVVVGPIWDSSEPSAGAVAANARVRASAESAGLSFIDALAEDWLGDPGLIQSADGVHATDEGQRVLGEHILQHLSTLSY